MPVPIVTIFGGSGFIGRRSPSAWPGPAGGCGWRCADRTRRTSSAPTASSARSSRSRPTSATRPRPAPPSPGPRRSSTASGSWPRAAGRPSRRWSTRAPARIARISAEEGVARLVHVSAIGADRGERQPLRRRQGPRRGGSGEAFPGAVILRPSIVFGADDSFFNRFAAMARITPVLPVVGPETRFQPVYVNDVAAAAVTAVTTDAAPGVYELGGPEVATFRDADAAAARRSSSAAGCVVALPFWLAGIRPGSSTSARALTRGLVTNGVLTRDQVRLLSRDNVVAPGARGLADLGIDADRDGRGPRELSLRVPPARAVRRHHRQRRRTCGPDLGASSLPGRGPPRGHRGADRVHPGLLHRPHPARRPFPRLPLDRQGLRGADPARRDPRHPVGLCRPPARARPRAAERPRRPPLRRRRAAGLPARRRSPASCCTTSSRPCSSRPRC